MPDNRVTAVGKQLLLDGKHLADARDEISAQAMALLLNRGVDPFDNTVDPAIRRDFGWVIRETPNLLWLLLTKRIGNAPEMLEHMFSGAIAQVADHVMVGATFVNQSEVDRDWEKLMDVSHHFGFRTFGSFEPLLGPIELPPFGSPYIDWVIAGGESGGGARPVCLSWARSLRDQCVSARVPFFVKQLSSGGPRPTWMLD